MSLVNIFWATVQPMNHKTEQSDLYHQLGLPPHQSPKIGSGTRGWMTGSYGWLRSQTPHERPGELDDHQASSRIIRSLCLWSLTNRRAFPSFVFCEFVTSQSVPVAVPLRWFDTFRMSTSLESIVVRTWYIVKTRNFAKYLPHDGNNDTYLRSSRRLINLFSPAEFRLGFFFPVHKGGFSMSDKSEGLKTIEGMKRRESPIA